MRLSRQRWLAWIGVSAALHAALVVAILASPFARLLKLRAPPAATVHVRIVQQPREP